LVLLVLWVKSTRRRDIFASIVDYPLEAVAEQVRAEVHEQAQRLIHQSQVGEQLLRMNGNEPLNGFDLDDKAAFHDEIRSKRVPNESATICDRNGFLRFDTESTLDQARREKGFVGRLEQARADIVMNLKAAVDRCLGQRFYIERHILV